MTADEKLKAFWRKGCFSRSVLYVSRDTSPMSDEKYIETYEPYFHGGDSYGQLTETGLEKVLADFRLKWLGKTEDYQTATDAFNEGYLILLGSKRPLWPPDHEEKDYLDHSSVLEFIDERKFTVWTSYQNGSEAPVTLAAKYWTRKECMALVFQRVADVP